MSNNISDKDKKVWNEFIKGNEKLPNKDSKIIKKKKFKKKLIDLHGYTLDEANELIHEITDAKIEDGGSGAFYIFLKKNKSTK